MFLARNAREAKHRGEGGPPHHAKNRIEVGRILGISVRQVCYRSLRRFEGVLSSRCVSWARQKTSHSSGRFVLSDVDRQEMIVGVTKGVFPVSKELTTLHQHNTLEGYCLCTGLEEVHSSL